MPYSIVVLSHALVALKHNSRRTQIAHSLVNVRNCPSQGSVWSSVDPLHLLNTQHRIADAKNQRERFISYKRQTKHSLIKHSRPLSICSSQEQDWFIERRHTSA